LTIDTTGNVGIGTTSPTAKLHIAGFSTGSGLKINYGNSVGTIEAVNFIANGGANGVIGMQMVSAGVGDLWLGGSGGRSLTLYRDGNVGIGTTSPASKLDVNGDIAVKGTSVFNLNSAALTIGDIAGTDSVTNLTLTTAGGSTEVFLDDSGNVGINDTTPSYALDVTGTIRATGDVIAYSDARVKENVETIPNALDKVKAMRGVGYNKIGEEKRSIGVIAQEMLDVIPEVVHTDDQGMHSVAYGNLVGVLIEAMKEQQQQIDELKALIASK